MNNEFMSAALSLAKEAYADDEVPVGAVITQNGKIISTGRNRREKSKNALLHAEIDAINNACKKVGGWAWNCEIYLTLEPCPMCAGAIINAHIPKVFFGAYDFKNGACGTITILFEMPFHSISNTNFGRIMEEECSELLEKFQSVGKKILISENCRP